MGGREEERGREGGKGEGGREERGREGGRKGGGREGGREREGEKVKPVNNNLIKEEEVEERVMIHNMKLILATHSIQNCHDLLTIESIIPQPLY